MGSDSDAESLTSWQSQLLLEAHLPSVCQPQLEPREVCHMGPPALEPCSVPPTAAEKKV